MIPPQVQNEMAKRDFAIWQALQEGGHEWRSVDRLVSQRLVSRGRLPLERTWRDYIFIMQEA